MDDPLITIRRTSLALTLAFAGAWALPALHAIQPAQASEASSGEAIALHGTAQGVAACVSCHGAKGEGNAAAGFPRLAGISAAYLSTQLNAFADGTRANPIMQPMARLLSAEERTAVASYFAALPSPSALTTKTPTNDAAKPSDLGAWLATRGRWDQGLPACVQCHGPNGIGVAPTFPPLAGQPAAYLAAQLHGWKDGQRPPGPMALMPAIASKLSDADIAAVADYYAGLDKAANGSKP